VAMPVMPAWVVGGELPHGVQAGQVRAPRAGSDWRAARTARYRDRRAVARTCRLTSSTHRGNPT
jgi:hypothetical protein